MRKICLILLTIFCLAGCSSNTPKNLTPIGGDDERLVAYYDSYIDETEVKKQLSMKNAPAAVYTGEYDSFSIPAELGIVGVYCAVGDNGFLVLKSRNEKNDDGFDQYEYGIYSLDGSYQRLFDDNDDFISMIGNKLLFVRDHSFGTMDRLYNGFKEFAVYSLDGSPVGAVSAKSEDELVVITYYNDDYIVYIVKKPEDEKHEACELHLLALDDFSDKTICQFSHSNDERNFHHYSIIHNNALYFEAIAGERPAVYSIMKYDIGSGETEEIFGNIKAMDSTLIKIPFAIYKDKVVYSDSSDRLMCIDGNKPAPLMDLTKYGSDRDNIQIFPNIILYCSHDTDTGKTTVNYIKDEALLAILEGDNIGFYNFSANDDYAVWQPYLVDRYLPMFYDIKNNIVILIDDEIAYYNQNFIYNNKIYFIDRKYDSENERWDIRGLILDTKNLR